MKVHYFDQDRADPDDHLLGMAKMQGYVPQACLLGGQTVMAEVNSCKSPCSGCNGPREKCGGKQKQVDHQSSNQSLPDDDYWDDEPECSRCGGDGRDPQNDYLLPCPLCQGEQH